MRTRMRWMVLSMLVAVVILAAAPGGTQAQAQSGPRVIEVQMVSFRFIPNLITLRQGETVVLRMVNADPDRRNHSIAARLFVGTTVTTRGDVFRTGVDDERRFFAAEPGKSFEIEFTATARGTHPFVCGVFDHGARGQTGAFNILAPAASP